MRPGRSTAAAGILLVVGLGGACAPPDRPAALPPPLSDDVVALLSPDTVRTLRVAGGAFYHYLWSERGPWAVHLVRLDLTRCDLALRVVRAPPSGDEAGGRARVTELVRTLAPDAVAAVNGDFFTPEGTPVGPEVTDRGMRSPGRRPAFAWSASAGPWIGTTRTEVDGGLWAGSVTVRRRTASPGAGGGAGSEAGASPTTAGPPSGAPGLAAGFALVAGFPELLDGGRPVGDLEVSARPSFAAARHPRTGIGYADGGRTLWLVVVDGRQPPHSAGMSLPELAELFDALGAEEALNLDGGGSSVLVVGGRAVSRPSDDSGERPVVNALVVAEGDRYCRA